MPRCSKAGKSIPSPRWKPRSSGVRLTWNDAAGVGRLPVSPPAQRTHALEFLRQDPRLQIARRSRHSVLRRRQQCRLRRQGSAPSTELPSVRHNASAQSSWAAMPRVNSIMLPPPLGQFGKMGRNTFPDSGFKNLDFSFAKNWHFGERYVCSSAPSSSTSLTTRTSPTRTAGKTGTV